MLCYNVLAFVYNYNAWSSVFDYVVGLDIYVRYNFDIFLVCDRLSCVLLPLL